MTTRRPLPTAARRLAPLVVALNAILAVGGIALALATDTDALAGRQEWVSMAISPPEDGVIGPDNPIAVDLPRWIALVFLLLPTCRLGSVVSVVRRGEVTAVVRETMHVSLWLRERPR